MYFDMLSTNSWNQTRVEVMGLEPTTSTLQRSHSSQLSYTPVRRRQLNHGGVDGAPTFGRCAEVVTVDPIGSPSAYPSPVRRLPDVTADPPAHPPWGGVTARCVIS